MSPEELAIIGVGVPGAHIDVVRPSWDEYFLAMAELVSTRSLDSNTKHGCVMVRDKRVIATGYNGPPADMPDSEIPNTRLTLDPGSSNEYTPKYDVMTHAEVNAILYAARHGIRLEGCTAYITGPSCHNCLRTLLGTGITHLVVGTRGHVANARAQAWSRYWIDRGRFVIRQINQKV